MSMHKRGRGSPKLPRGEVDLEALQDAFLRNREKPSAKLIRSKPPSIKADSSRAGSGVSHEAHTSRRTPSVSTATGGDAIGGVVEGARMASSARTASTLPSAFREHGRAAAAAAASSSSEAQGDSTDPAVSTTGRAPTGGGMVLDAPVVVSSVREREVRAPTPIKIAVGKGGALRPSRKDRDGGCGALGAARGILGGFPAVRHRSEMGGFKLATAAAAVAAGATTFDSIGDCSGGVAASGGPSPSDRHHSRQDFSDVSSAGVRGSRDGDGLRDGGKGIPRDIHEENLSRVASMSADEVAEAQQEIRAALSPAAVETLMRRARTKGLRREGMEKVHGGRAGGGGGSGVPFGHEVVRSNLVPTPRDAQDLLERDGLASGGRIAGGAGGRESTGKERETARSGDVAHTFSADSATDSGTDSAITTPAAAVDSLKPAKPIAGAPTGAQRIATAAGGVGSEQALEDALRFLPSEERAKSAWTLSDEAATQRGVAVGGESGEVRVDLDGDVVGTAAADSERGGALHHHGNDPDKAGYTPSELVRLARSTVSGQRQLALRALSGVLVNRAADIRRGDAPPHPRIPPMLPIAIRMCLDDGNSAVALAGLRALEAYLAPLARHYEEVEDRIQGLSWLDYQAFPRKVRPLCTPDEEAVLPRIDDAHDVGNPSDNGSPLAGQGDSMSAAELARMCQEDPCRGMLEMAVLPKLSSMIRTYAAAAPAESDSGGARQAGVLQPRAALSCLRILRAAAERAPWAALRVAREPGLMEGVREAFLEPREDGSLPFDLSERPLTQPPIDADGATPPVGLARTRQLEDISPERLAVMAVRLTRSLVQSGRDVAIFVASTPLLETTKGLLALGQGLRRPRQALLAAHREVLELWRCCLSYGIDVSAADTVVLVARGQGWWPGLDVRPNGDSLGSGAHSAAATPVNVSGGNYTVEGRGGGGKGGNTSDQDASDVSLLDDAAFGLDVGVAAAVMTPRLAFLRAMHQLACVCVLPPRQKSAKGDGGAAVGRSDSRRPAAVRDDDGEAKKKDPVSYVLGGVSVATETWTDVGDTVDAAVESSLRRLLSDDRVRGTDGRVEAADRSGKREGTLEMPLQSASIHLVACWLERYRLMSRTAGAGLRGVQHLETTAEDAALLFSSLLASCVLPAAVEIATRSYPAEATAANAQDFPSGAGNNTNNGNGGGGTTNTVGVNRAEFTAGRATPSFLAASHYKERGEDEARGVDIAAAMVAAMDWLSGIFRLGLACERAAPGEAAAALAACSGVAKAALSDFLTRYPSQILCRGAESGEERPTKSRRGDRAADGDVAWRRSLRRASASARWLGCRLMALARVNKSHEEAKETDEVDQGRPSWETLRRDCALNVIPFQAVALCEPGDEAIAVGLMAEALREISVGSRGKYDEQTNGSESITSAPTLLRKLFRGAVSDSAAFAHASFHLDGRWSSLQSLEASAPPGTASLLPLPQHWLFLPLASQGGERAASAAVSACLSVLVQLEREGSSYVESASNAGGVSSSSDASADSTNAVTVTTTTLGREGVGVAPEVKLYHLMNTCMYGAAVFSSGDNRAEGDFEWLLDRYLHQCGRGFEARLVKTIARLSIASASDPAKIIADAAANAAAYGATSTLSPSSARSGGETSITGRERAHAARAQSHAERALLEFVKDLVGIFLADSFGLPSFARVLRVFARTSFPVAARCIIWNELGTVGLLPLLDAAPWPSIPEMYSRTGNSLGHVPIEVNSRWSTAGHGGGGDQDESRVASDSWSDAYLYPPDADPAILDAYMTALEHLRFDAGGKEDHGGDAWRNKSSAGDANGETNNERSDNDGTDLAANTAPVRRMERKSMLAVAVHHLACYLYARSALPMCGDGEAKGENNGLRGEDVATKLPPLAWRPDFGRRKMMERLLLVGGRDGRGGMAGSTLPSVLGHECAGTNYYYDDVVSYCCNEGGVESRDRGSSNDPRGRWQRQEANAGRGRNEEDRGATGTNMKPIVVAPALSSEPLLPLALERGDDHCRRNMCWRVATLGHSRREILQAYCLSGMSAGTIGAGNGGDREIERCDKIGDWLIAEDRRVEDVIRRLPSRGT